MEKLSMKKLSGPKKLSLRGAHQKRKRKKKTSAEIGRITTSRTHIPGVRRVGKEGSSRVYSSRTNIPGIRRVG